MFYLYKTNPAASWTILMKKLRSIYSYKNKDRHTDKCNKIA